MVHIYGLLIFGTILNIVSIVCNVLGTVVLAKIQKTVPGVRLLKYMAVLDSISSLVFLFFFSLALIPASEMTFSVFAGVFIVFHVTDMIILMFYLGEMMLTVLIGCQRAFALVKPRRYNAIFTDSFINKCLLGICIVTVVLIIPNVMLVMYKSKEILSIVNNSTTTRATQSSENEQSLIYRIYRQYLGFIFCLILPIFILIVCTIAIMKATRKRGRSQTVINTGFDLARTNVAIITVFIVTFVPLYLSKGLQFPYTVRIIVFLLYTLRAPANFLIYFVGSPLVRNTLKEFFTRKANSNVVNEPVLGISNQNTQESEREDITKRDTSV